MLSKATLLLVIIFQVSCSLFIREERVEHEYVYSQQDYLAHVRQLENNFLQNNKSHVFQIEGNELNYFKNILNTLISNNEYILKRGNLDTKLYIVSSPLAFHYSLPGPHFYLSTTLITKYLKSEKIFIALLSFDLIKCLNNLFYKRIMVPTGDVNFEDLLAITQLNSDYNKEIAKWTYVVLKRSGYDPVSFLNWLQIQNKNPSDFRILYDDQRYLNEIESSYKNFLIEKEKSTRLSEEDSTNSSKGFYALLDKIKRRNL